MSSLWMTPGLLIGTVSLIAVAMMLLQRRYPLDQTPLIDAIDAQLPQTQCAQCGYPGCRPYAEAVANGAPIDLCPPGGEATFIALKQLMGGEAPAAPSANPVLAVIDESRCIGCTLCLPACPVDAIVGTAGQMHTVIAQDCTGCELCIDPCPVDCIDLLALDPPQPAEPLDAPACIRCGACEPVCPVNLDPQALYMLVQDNNITSAEQHHLDRCIECGLCDRACPEQIPLAGHFQQGKQALRLEQTEQLNRQQLLDRFAAHNQRQQQRAQKSEQRRQQRLANRGGKQAW